MAFTGTTLAVDVVVGAWQDGEWVVPCAGWSVDQQAVLQSTACWSRALTAMTDGALTACRKCCRPRKRRPSIVSGRIGRVAAVIGWASVQRVVVMTIVFLRNRSLGISTVVRRKHVPTFRVQVKGQLSRSHLAHQVVYSWSQSGMTT